MYVSDGSLSGLKFSSRFTRLIPHRRVRPTRPMGRVSRFSGLGRMTAEQEAEKKAVKQFFKAQRKQVKGHKARVAAGVNKKTQRQALKMLKQSYKLGVPISAPSQQPGFPIVPMFPPISQGGGAVTGGGGGGGGGGAYPDDGSGEAPAEGGSMLGPLALAAAAAGVYFLA